ncbi:hypothetical protein OROGR_026333 [Orobanche gracilis]
MFPLRCGICAYGSCSFLFGGPVCIFCDTVGCCRISLLIIHFADASDVERCDHFDIRTPRGLGPPCFPGRLSSRYIEISVLFSLHSQCSLLDGENPIRPNYFVFIYPGSPVSVNPPTPTSNILTKRLLPHSLTSERFSRMLELNESSK